MIPTGQEFRRCLCCGQPAVTISVLDKILEKPPGRWFCTKCAKKEAQLLVDLGKHIMERESVDSAKLAG